MKHVAQSQLKDTWSQWSATKHIRAVYQPIVSLRDGSVFAFEGLSRPYHTSGSAVDVSLLIASAETHQQLLIFDSVAFSAVLDQVGRLPYDPRHRFFINILPQSLKNPWEFLRQIQAHPLIKPQQLVLEISERETIDGGDERLQEYLEPFRALGVCIALDDLGSGYSGLNRLVALKPDFAKIDLSLVRDVDRNSIKLALLESTAAFAAKTGAIALIAEGIETLAELYTLKEIGIDYGQGYLLGKPLDHLESALPPSRFAVGHQPRLSPQVKLDTLLTSLHRMVQGLARGEGRYSHLLALAKRLSGADVAALYKAEPAGLRYFASTVLLTEPEKAAFNRTLDPAKSSIYQSMLNRRPAVFQNAAERPGPWAAQFGLESRLVVPVCDNTGCWGMLHLGFYQPDQIRPDLIQMSEGIASLFALALNFAEHPDSVADLGQLGEPLFEAIASLAETDTLERLLAKTVSAALATTQGHEGWIGLLTPSHLHCVTADGSSFDFDRESLFDPRTDDGQGPVGQILQRRIMMVIPNIVAEPTLLPWMEDMQASGISSAAGIPLISQGRLLGLLKVYHSEIGGFTPGRIRRIQALSSLATTLIEQSLNSTASENLARRQGLLASGMARVNYCQNSQQILELMASTLADYGPYPLVAVVQSQKPGTGKILLTHSQSPDAARWFEETFPFRLPESGSPEALSPDATRLVPAISMFSALPPDLFPDPELANCAVIPMGIAGQSAVLLASSDTLNQPEVQELESYVRSLGAALLRNVLQEQIAEEQRQTDLLLQAVRSMPEAKNFTDLWLQVGNVLLHHFGATGGWVLDSTSTPSPVATFGAIPPGYDWCPDLPGSRPAVLPLEPGSMPPALETLGVQALCVFPVTLPSLNRTGLFFIASQDPEGFPQSMIHRMTLLTSFAASSYEILKLRERSAAALESDALTGLPNYMALERHYQQWQRHSEPDGAVVMLYDIAGMGLVNQEQGKELGDEQLVRTAAYLRHIVPVGGLAARLGSDDFVQAFPAWPGWEQEAAAVAATSSLPLRWSAVFIADPASCPLAKVVPCLYRNLHGQGSGTVSTL